METYDPQGSIVESSLDNDSLGSQGEYAKSVFVYDGFGGLRSSESTSGSSPARHKDPAGFGGQYGYYQDLQTGLEHLGARYYDGGTGRFVTRDPIGYGGGENLYAFCGNNPITGSDPSGLTVIPPTTAAGLKLWKEAFKYLSMSKTFMTIYNALNEKGASDFQIVPNHHYDDSYDSSDHSINWDPYEEVALQKLVYDKKGNEISFKKEPETHQATSAALNLAHEMGHAYRDSEGKSLPEIVPDKGPYTYDEEKENIMENEQPIARELGEPIRNNWRGQPFHGSSPISRVWLTPKVAPRWGVIQ